MDQEVKENEEKVEEACSTSETSPESEHKKHNFKVWLFSAIAILVVIFLVCAPTVLGKVSAKKVFAIFPNNAISKLYESMSEDIKLGNNSSNKFSINTEELSTLFGDSINFGIVSLKTKNVKSNNNASGRLSLLLDEQEVIEADYAKTKDIYGIAVEGLFKNYIAVENNNLKALYKKINPNVTDEELNEIPDRIEAADFNSSDKDKLIDIGKKYVGTLAKFYEKNAIRTLNVPIEISKQNINATKYELNIDNENGYKLLNDILKIAENDEDLYNFIKKYDAKGSIECNSFEEWKEIVKATRNEIQEDILNENYEAGIISFNIYEKDGMAVRYEFALNEFEDGLDFTITFDTIELNGNVLGIISYKTNGEYKTEYSIEVEMNKSNKTYSGKLTFKVTISDLAPMEIEFATFEIDLQDDDIGELVWLTNENTLILNTATDEEIDALVGEIKGNILSTLAKVLKKLPENIKNRIIENGSGEKELEYENDIDKNESEEELKTESIIDETERKEEV